MSDKPILQPGPDHPITITPNSQRVVVSLDGHTIADTTSALSLQEADYPVVHYVPLADVDQARLQPTEHSTYCPYKGDASYYSIPVGGAAADNAVWSYRSPFDAVAEIKDYVAFYPDRVAISVGE
jgi:uncharacterized protein (DUF427 family)